MTLVSRAETFCERLRSEESQMSHIGGTYRSCDPAETVYRLAMHQREFGITDDDEVAVTHASSEQGYRALSEAMANIRERCDTAVQTGIIRFADAQRIVKIAKSMHFSQRHWEAVFHRAIAEGVDEKAIQALKDFRNRFPQGAKERDAIALLRYFAGVDSQRQEKPKTPLRVHQTAFLADLKQQVTREVVPGPEEAPGTAVNVARKKVLLGMLAKREVTRRGLMIGPDDVGDMTRWFRGTYALEDGDQFLTWKANHALPETDFAFAMQRFTEVTRVEEACGQEIDDELDTYLRVYSAAAENQAEVPAWVQLNIGLGRDAEDAQSSARILFGRLMPVLRRLSRRGLVDSFHFVRKAPDVRLRFRAMAPDQYLLPRVGKTIRMLHEDGAVVSVFRSVYEPEARVFGGAEAMEVVHEYFDADSRGWIHWNQGPAAGQRVAAEQLCTAIINDLFLSALGCPNEVWDAWNNLCELTHKAKSAAPRPIAPISVQGNETFASIRNGDPGAAVVLKHYARANQAFSASINQVLEQGRLNIGIRSLLAAMAMFHCNRFGLDGAKQFSIAERAVNAWHPCSSIKPAGRRQRLARSGQDRVRASRNAESRVLD